jgi:hypothetical protein
VSSGGDTDSKHVRAQEIHMCCVDTECASSQSIHHPKLSVEARYMGVGTHSETLLLASSKLENCHLIGLVCVGGGGGAVCCTQGRGEVSNGGDTAGKLGAGGG